MRQRIPVSIGSILVDQLLRQGGRAGAGAFADQDRDPLDPGSLGADQAPLAGDPGIGLVLFQLDGKGLNDAGLAQARLKPARASCAGAGSRPSSTVIVSVSRTAESAGPWNAP